MDLAFWWLLIITVVFMLGWAAARYNLRYLRSKSENLLSSCFKGLNFLLNKKPDQTIDTFIEAVKLHPEITELHFALGNLFRQRGAIDCAIQMHQNLLLRADLRPNERHHTLYELGQDFLKAGLLDRAEEAFQRLYGSEYALSALQALLTIFEIEKEWHKAIVVAQQIEAMGILPLRKEISQFYCELTQEALQYKKIDNARIALKQALCSNPKNIRVTLLSGDIEIACNKPVQAINYWRQIEQQNPAYLLLVAHKLMQAYTAIGQSQKGVALLAHYVEAYYSSDLLDVAYQHIAELSGIDSAHALIRVKMQQSPNLVAMQRLLEAQIMIAEEPYKSELELMRTLIRRHAKNMPRYMCQNCSFQAKLFYWRCPSCGGWETYIPQRIEPIN
ncbi:lipopolysaccharide assembly protein LapB [Candidatus Vallotia tarda]|uniref:Lipopolysaccharide assembly protein B n=1 Tax=Candidatus Vallotiella hemipterorum TaxID=1177213 RepID=A0A916NEQ2_9BURK|nr:lipopolysaccharide assembly protein LapB [Candidatus Vallotia tarda]CAG7598182.1 Lipopolysaccharide assembly protein LapB [Candidatus Vallotia tarda]